MMPAIGAHVERANEAFADVYVPALIALLPGVCRDFELYPLGRARLTFLFEPGHSRHISDEAHNLSQRFPTRQSRGTKSLSQFGITRLPRLPRNPECNTHANQTRQQE